MNEIFRKLSQRISIVVGSPWAFTFALVVILVWAITGPLFHFSDTWQLVINTGTTIITFLMVFLIQNTQNRDARAMHVKLDELIRSIETARNSLVDIENLPDETLNTVQKEFKELREKTDDIIEEAVNNAKYDPDAGRSTSVDQT
jgi:low affinity Fe/Cu permease